MAGTLKDMKSRIADELSRADLTLEIARAISDAISIYQPTRFLFNESRDITFDTVAGQEWYDLNDEPNIPDLLSIDYVKIQVNNVLWTITRREPEELEYAVIANGQPWSYTYYNQQIRLYPIPTDIWTIRVAAHILLAAPATDTEINNPWMTYAERLIRAEAKRQLYLNIDDLNTTEAEYQEVLVRDALSQLKGRTAKMLGRGKITPYY